MLVGSSPESTLRATVKILDIGLGRTLFEEGAGEPGDLGLTAEGVLLGTPDYMSPEQARDPRHSDIRADIYSLGCVLYHLLAGQPPFPDTNIISQMIRHATETARPLKELNPAVPDGLQQIVNWMMAKEPAQRYPTPERAAQALQVFLAAGSAAVGRSGSGPAYAAIPDLAGSGEQEASACCCRRHALRSQTPDRHLSVRQAAQAAQVGPDARGEGPAPRRQAPQEKTPTAAGPGSPPPATAEKAVRIDVELVPITSSPTASKTTQGIASEPPRCNRVRHRRHRWALSSPSWAP